MRYLIITLLICGLSSVEIPAQVVSIVDGDTIVVKIASAEERIRLLYLDTPESKGSKHGPASPEGKLAAEFMAKQIEIGSAVTLWGPGGELKHDPYRRILAVIDAYSLSWSLAEEIRSKNASSWQDGLLYGRNSGRQTRNGETSLWQQKRRPDMRRPGHGQRIRST